MNATLGEIALNHALSHDTPVDDVILENVEGAAEAAKAQKDGAQKAGAQTQGTSRSDKSSTDREKVKTEPATFRERVEAVIARGEELTRENPRKALAIAAGAGVVVGVSLLSVPVLRTVAKRAAMAAIKGGGMAGIGSEIGGQALERLEGLLAKK